MMNFIKIASVTMLGVCVLLSGCQSNTTDTTSNSETKESSVDSADVVAQGEDKTVSVTDVINIEEYEKIEEIESENDYAISADLSDMSEAAEEIVEATILSVDYVSVSGNAWTKVDLQIIQSLKGNLQENDKITLYQSGGYVSVKDHIKYYDDAFRYRDWTKKEIKSTLYHETVDGEETPEVGTEAIYYLSLYTRDNFPDGIYSRVRGKYAELEKVSNNRYRHEMGKKDDAYEEISITEVKESL